MSFQTLHKRYSHSYKSNLEQFIETGEPGFLYGNYPGVTALKMLKNFEYHAVYNHFEVQTFRSVRS